jgi:hypothetical protein
MSKKLVISNQVQEARVSIISNIPLHSPSHGFLHGELGRTPNVMLSRTRMREVSIFRSRPSTDLFLHLGDDRPVLLCCMQRNKL